MRGRRSANGQTSRFAIYLRCSTDDQRQGDFTTIDAQRELNRLHVSALGGHVVREYADEGRTGSNLDRPGWKQMLADAQAGFFDQVCVTYMSRLGRGNAYIIAEYELSKHGVAVEMVKEKFDDGLSGYMNKTFTTFMDGVYPKMVSSWVRTKMERMVERGYHCGGRTPFGYQTVFVADAGAFKSAEKDPPKRLEPHPDTAGLVRTAFDMAFSGASSASIRDYLASVTAREWTTEGVRKLLSNEVYTGVQRFGDWCNETAHTAIVDPEVFAAVGMTLEAKSTRYARRSDDGFRYSLAGLVRCPHCGCACTHAAFHGRNRRAHYYTCRNANRRGACPVGRVNAEKLHRSIVEQIGYAGEHLTVIRRLVCDSDTWSAPDERLCAMRGQLAKRKQHLETQIENLTTAVGEGRAVGPLLTAIEKADAELVAVNAELERVTGEVAAASRKRPAAADVGLFWQEFAQLYRLGGEDERASLLQAMVLSVDLTAKKLVTVEALAAPLAGHAHWFASKPSLVAGGGLEPPTYGL